MSFFRPTSSRATRVHRRRLASLSVGFVITSLGALVSVVGSPASAQIVGIEAEFATRINEARIAAGLVPLTVVEKLADGARDWSFKMSKASGPDLGSACKLSHNPKLAKEVRLRWKVLGENVGCAASSAEAMHQAFMNSPLHRKNILDPKFDSVGVAIATSDTTIFVTEVFMQTQTLTPRPTRKPSKNFSIGRSSSGKKSKPIREVTRFSDS
jgi:uncharacterized protein YkwD